MAVTRVDANGNSTAPAGPKTSAPTTPADNTGSANIRRPSGWTHPAQKGGGTAAAGLPRGTTGAKEAINKALAELFDETVLLQAARDSCDKDPEDESLKAAYKDAGHRQNGARANLGQVIARQADQLSHRSSLVPQGKRHDAYENPPPSSSDVRRWEQTFISDHTKSPLETRLVEDAVLKNKELRLPGELELLSAAMTAKSVTNGQLNRFQNLERDAIIADFKDVVTGRRPEEQGKSPEDLKTARLGRLHGVLDSVTKKIENEGQKLDPYLFDRLIREVRLHLDLSEADRDALLKKYGARLGPRT